MSEQAERYTAVAIVLHWAIAAAILFMLPLGFWMHERIEDGEVTDGVFRAFQLHKSVGLAILGLTLVRLGWRLTNRVPPLPARMPAWERFAARGTHWGFYALTLAMPLSGWLYVSTDWSIHEDGPLSIPTRFFGLFAVPALFGLSEAGAEVREETAEAAFAAHVFMAWSMIALLGLHVLAALKHHVVDKDAVLAQMIPGVRAPGAAPAPKNAGRLAVLGGGLGLTAIALAAGLYAATTFTVSTAPPPQAGSQIEIADSQAPTATTVDANTEEAAAASPGAPASAGPVAWRIDPSASTVGFAFTFDDGESQTRFEGRFTRWRADIRFDPDNLDQSRAAVTIETASATDGVQLHDNSLPTEPWFNAGAHPTATFRTTRIRREGGRYVARGDLTIKSRTRQVELPFTLAIEGDRARMSGRTTIDRRDFDIGERSEAAEMISRDVEISVRVEAVRAP